MHTMTLCWVAMVQLPYNKSNQIKCLYWFRIYICKYGILTPIKMKQEYEIAMNTKQTNTHHTYIYIYNIYRYILRQENWKTTRRAIPLDSEYPIATIQILPYITTYIWQMISPLNNMPTFKRVYHQMVKILRFLNCLIFLHTCTQSISLSVD